MKIFIAGATGAVGRLLLPMLVQAGHQVVGTTRRTEKAASIEKTGARAVVADVYDLESLTAVLREVRPDVVMHQLTALSDMDFAENSRVRIEGPRNLVDACLRAGVNHIVAQSVAWAYALGDGLAVEADALDSEADGARGRFVRGVTALEHAVSELPQYVILRYGKLYGPGTWYDKDEMTAQQVLAGELTATPGIESFLHVADAAHAAVEALQWPNGAVNIVDDNPAPGTQWVPVYAKALGAPMPPVSQTCEGWERGASNRKARREYGWRPTYPSWELGFSESLQ
ncbi:NAD(P)-dependent oxidoreductase [Alicyclobacillus sp. SO9]|uniref:NAD-dependent epimerase/dehydratase family protein n=1 Tax=Alicyclobacillus sp. SO9 TaxID=2665646 RepID=UPI0018E78E17|nr:NAD(P)-dependent oxidoreductase [Alicyclobacillus sp. SO9]QQE78867.1 NAD(P)-dependent oxidoreductase [Alicyclobacillus sp. SO9]